MVLNAAKIVSQQGNVQKIASIHYLSLSFRVIRMTQVSQTAFTAAVVATNINMRASFCGS